MMFGQRWVPMEVMNTIFALWAVAAVIVVVLLLWLRQVGRAKKANQSPARTPGTEKRNRSKKRGGALLTEEASTRKNAMKNRRP
jgi:beta-lactamase regulating signal transducer with metallopeptidase domain